MRILATLAAVLLLTGATLPAHADPFTSVVVYGDSLSDNGNLYRATFGLAPAPPYVNGRFSNGPVAVEQLAANLGAPLLDYAFGGATTGLGNTGDGGTVASPGLFGLPGITAEYFGSLVNGKLPAGASASSLFVVWGGANDYESLFDATSSNPTVAQSQAAATLAATNISKIVGALTLQGASTILVPNLPNLGSTPEFAGLDSAIAFTSTFNTALSASLPRSATLFDTNALFTAILANKTAYGFNDVTTPCIVAKADPGCSGYLFFDDIHPTTAADKILAQNFAAAVTPAAATPEPSSLLLLGTGLTGIAGFARRRKAARQS